nr:hypothetical protein GCM10020092_031850 [Actinoplanes digitatis]
MTASGALSRAIALSTLSGPISTNVVTPSEVSAPTAAEKRTVSRTCRTQYAGSATRAASATSPARPETSGIAGAAYDTVAATRPNSSSMASI